MTTSLVCGARRARERLLGRWARVSPAGWAAVCLPPLPCCGPCPRPGLAPDGSQRGPLLLPFFFVRCFCFFAQPHADCRPLRLTSVASPRNARLLPLVGGWAACGAGCPFGALLHRGSFQRGSEHLFSLLAVVVLSFSFLPLVPSVLGVHGFFPHGEVAE